MEKKIVRCIVAGINSNGEPDLFFVKISTNGEIEARHHHYDAAREYAEDEGYSEPFVCFDEFDRAGKAMLPLFEWDSASVVDA